MMKSIQTIFILLFFMSITKTRAIETSTQEELSLAYTLSKAGKHADAILRTQPLLNALKLDTVESIVLGNKILTVSYCELGEKDKAKEYLETLKAFSPDESFKEFNLSNACMDFFGIKRPAVKKIKPAEEEPVALPPPLPERLKPKDASWKLYMPFGTGQFYNDEPDKGWAFLATETVLLATTVTMLALFQFEKNDDGTFSNTNLAHAYKTTYWSSLGVAGGVSLWGIVDAIVTHKRRRA